MVDTLYQIAITADNYSLTHKMAFGKTHPWAPDHPEERLVEGNTSTGVDFSNFALETEQVTQMRIALKCLLVTPVSTVRRRATSCQSAGLLRRRIRGLWVRLLWSHLFPRR